MQPQRSKGAVKPRRQRRSKQRPIPTLTHDQPVPEAAVAIAAPAVAKADICWQSLGDEPSPERVHQFRVAMRQLRVVLHIFRKLSLTGDFKDLRHALRQIASEVGHKRDLDVMIAEIVQPFSKDGDGEDVHRLVDVLEQQRASGKDDVSRAVATADATRVRSQLPDLPERLAKAAEVANARTTIDKFAQRDLRKRWRRLAAMADTVDELSDIELHEMRKMLKNLRYAFAHFAPLYDKKDGDKFIKGLQRLQDAFGYLNDVTSARKFGERFKTERADPALAYAAGYVLGRHIERTRDVRHKIVKIWKRLADTAIAREIAEK